MGEKTHEDHIRNPGYSSLSHHNLVHEPIPIPEAMIILQPQAAVDRNGKIKEYASMARMKSESNTGGCRWGAKGRQDHALCDLHGFMSSPKIRNETMYHKLHRTCSVKRRCGKRRLWILCCLYGARFFYIAQVLDTISRLPGVVGQASDAVLAYTHVELK